ncbi:MAG: helix-turn-helix domain-containing protein [Armatimonadetes bacterium]|nr:helix-turn-helix domain-containing protein [Armatimonadota bacterium]
MPTLLENAVALSESDRRIASEASPYLEQLALQPHDVRVQFVGEAAANQIVSLPASAVLLLNEILKEMAKGNAVAITPVQTMLTTQEAADILNVSRPFLIGLLEAGKIPYQRLGSHRRILTRDLMAFKEKTDAAREEAFRALTQEAQELNMGY